MRKIIRNTYQLLLFITIGIAWPGLTLASNDNYFQILYDTSEPAIPGLKPGFGYAVYIHIDGKRILLDTGTDPDIMAHNLITAGVDVNSLDMVVISHNHHDHAGGLQRILELNPALPVYVPPGQVFAVSKVRTIEDNLQITPNLFVIRGHSDKPTAGISDDLSIVIRGQSGAYVLSTCSHSGVAQIIDRAGDITGDDVFYFSGGARLISRPDSDTLAVAETLDQRKVQVISPGHCSLSHRVDRQFRKALGDRIRASQLGRKIPIELPK